MGFSKITVLDCQAQLLCLPRPLLGRKTRTRRVLRAQREKRYTSMLARVHACFWFGQDVGSFSKWELQKTRHICCLTGASASRHDNCTQPKTAPVHSCSCNAGSAHTCSVALCTSPLHPNTRASCVEQRNTSFRPCFEGAFESITGLGSPGIVCCRALSTNVGSVAHSVVHHCAQIRLQLTRIRPCTVHAKPPLSRDLFRAPLVALPPYQVATMSPSAEHEPVYMALSVVYVRAFVGQFVCWH